MKTENKVWLITGVSKGLGKEIAKAAAASGDIVVGTVRSINDQALFERELKAKAFVIDLSEIEKTESLIETVIHQYGKIDVLVNNAGYGVFGMIEEFETEEIRKEFEVNFVAVWKLCKAVLPYMRKAGSGTIVQISSRLALQAGPGNGIYAAGKFALEGLSEALKQEVDPFGIKVLLAEPGALRTDFFGNSVRYAKNEIAAYIPVSDIRKNTKKRHQNQKGDPQKAAEIIVKEVKEGVRSLRLPLTKGTIDVMKSKIEEYREIIKRFSSLAESIDIPD